jgi:hypothetical protein
LTREWVGPHIKRIEMGRFTNGTMQRLGTRHVERITGIVDRRSVTLHHLRQRESTETIRGLRRRKFKHPSN